MGLNGIMKLTKERQEEMKKYFLKGVDEPLEFGDKIGFDVVKESEDGKSVTKHIETTFIPEIIPMLLDLDAIEEKEDTIDFTDDKEEDDDCEFVNQLIDTLETLGEVVKEQSNRIDKLEEKVNYLKLVNKPSKEDCYYNIKDFFKRADPLVSPITAFYFSESL